MSRASLSRPASFRPFAWDVGEVAGDKAGRFTAPAACEPLAHNKLIRPLTGLVLLGDFPPSTPFYSLGAATKMARF